MEKIIETLAQKLSEFNATSSPNVDKKIEIVLVKADDTNSGEFHGIQSKLTYVNFDTNLDELAKKMNDELTEQEKQVLGEKTILIRRVFNEEICKLSGANCPSYRLICGLPAMFDAVKGGCPVFAYASIAVK